MADAEDQSNTIRSKKKGGAVKLPPCVTTEGRGV
jgi:hypothetical protein